MVQRAKKYYVVWKGLTPGVYASWADCKAQVDGFPGAQYRGYATLEEAKQAYAKPFVPPHTSTAPSWLTASVKPVLPSVAVDAACNMKTGTMEYRGVVTDTRQVIFAMGPFPDTTNNVGEFLALVHAIALLSQAENPALHTYPIYSDSITALSWVRHKKANTAMPPTPNNAPLRALVQRAEKWLQQHHWDNPLYKWRTKDWGEIPADYGRK